MGGCGRELKGGGQPSIENGFFVNYADSIHLQSSTEGKKEKKETCTILHT